MPIENAPFSAPEYARRLACVRAAMAARDIEVLFVEDPSNMAWLTGYDGWSFYVHQGVLIFHDQDPLWWGRRQDANGAFATVWMERERVTWYGDHFVQSTACHPMQDLAEKLSDLGHAHARIGVEMENYYFSAKAYLTLCESLPGAEIVDVTALVNRQRTVKSDEELVFMRRAAAISEKIIDGIWEAVEPGLPKNELVAGIYHDAIMGANGHWGDYPAIVPLLPSGPYAAAPHLTWDGAVFETGAATFFEISGCYRRYHAPFCRTIYLGQPPQFFLDAEAALIEGLEEGLEAARPGNRACDVADALARPLERIGIERGARCGYPIGLSYPPDWGERTISLRPEDETVFEPGMTFHFMPGLWMQNWGLEITESILIREDGPAETFCNRPRQLYVKE